MWSLKIIIFVTLFFLVSAAYAGIPAEAIDAEPFKSLVRAKRASRRKAVSSSSSSDSSSSSSSSSSESDSSSSSEEKRRKRPRRPAYPGMGTPALKPIMFGILANMKKAEMARIQALKDKDNKEDAAVKAANAQAETPANAAPAAAEETSQSER